MCCLIQYKTTTCKKISLKSIINGIRDIPVLYVQMVSLRTMQPLLQSIKGARGPPITTRYYGKGKKYLVLRVNKAVIIVLKEIFLYHIN